MPNGGMLPCCRVCQFAQDAEALATISCQRHGIQITNALHTFCADLSDDRSPGLAAFIRRNTFAPAQVYIWTEVQYRTKDHPTLPQYQHQFIALTSITTYASWTDNERQAATAAQTQAHRNAVKRANGTPQKHMAWQRRIKAAFKRLRGKR